MRLEHGERSILAYFPTPEAANKTALELKQEGFTEVQVDRISKFGVNNDAEINNPITGRAETITGLTLYSAGTASLIDNGSRVLKAADPSVSGYGNHNYGIAGGEAFLVTVVTSEELSKLAEKIILNNGGKV